MFRLKRLSQNEITSNTSRVIIKHPLSVGCFFIIISILLKLLAGYLIGILGALISTNIFLPSQDSWLTYICALFAITTWGFGVISQGLKQAFLMVSLTSLVSLIIVTLLQKVGVIANSIQLAILIINSLSISIFFLSFVLISFSLHIFWVWFDKPYRKSGLILTLIPELSAVMAAYNYCFFSFRPLDGLVPLIPYLAILDIRRYAFWFGIIFSSVSILFNYILHRHSDKVNGLDFLKHWAIAIGSWGGTSFYGLDLSYVNFQRANLANTDLRAKTLFRTCFQDVTGLERARVNNQYLDLDNPKVQNLLIKGYSQDLDFYQSNLRGAYLQQTDMRGFNLSEANLTGADLQQVDLRQSLLIYAQLAGADLQQADLREGNLTDANLTGANCRKADLRNATLIRAQVARADFTGADLTGACIEDWSVSDKTTFTDVRCDYVFKQYENGQPTHPYPSDRNFEPGEFAALFQQPENELELIFKGDFSYSALSLAFDKLKTEKPELDLELKGIEQRGNLWVVRVTSSNPTVEAQLEQQFSEVYQTTTNSDSLETTIKDSIYRDYEDIKQRLAESQQLVRQFAGISESQAEALKQLSKQAFGTNFYIEGSAITNLTGQGQIEYSEAAGQIRSLVTQSGTEAQVSQGSRQVLTQLQDIATTPPMQTELIQQILLREAQGDPAFRRFLLQQQQQILTALPPGTIASAIQGAIGQLNSESSGNVV